jgi:hypothetical protein
MKKAAIYAATLLLGAWSNANAQSTTAQYLDNAIQTAENIPQDVQTASNAIDELVLELTVLNNPDANAFHNELFFLINNVQNNADDIDYFVGLTKAESQVDFSTAPVNALTTQLVVLNDEVIGLTTQITDAVLDNRNGDALSLIPDLRNMIAAQAETAQDIISEIEAIKSATTVYEVVIQLVNAQGTPVYYNDTHGFYAYSHATGTYLYPNHREDDNVFFLPAGTYTFDSFDGYFSGTGSNTVTLSDALVNEDGVIVVELVYWSE